MISLLISFGVLIVGYAVYGRVVEKVFSPDDRQTPAVAIHDYMAGMISSRHGGASIAELSGVYLGKGAMWLMRAFSVCSAGRCS